MTTYRPHLSAAEVHDSLRQSLAALRQAERNAVLWFAEIWQRKLYRELGYGSMYQYAALGLRFSRSKTAQFLRLARSLESLPVLRKSLEKGEVSWTKAREVVKVATPRTEAAWVEEARTTGRRELETRVAVARGKAKAAREGNRAQVALAIEGAPEPGGAEDRGRTPEEVPVDVHARFSPEQYARYEALLEKLRKNGERGSREELILAGLEALVTSPGTGADRGDAARRKRESGPHPEVRARQGESAGETHPVCTRVHTVPNYQVVVHVCEDCGRGEAITSRGPKSLAPDALRTVLCDARIQKPGERNRATIPPSVRRTVLARDHHRCRAAGCGSAHFLAVHHRIPRTAGGTNAPDNLVTLCGNCHRTVHRHEHMGNTAFRAAS